MRNMGIIWLQAPSTIGACSPASRRKDPFPGPFQKSSLERHNISMLENLKDVFSDLKINMIFLKIYYQTKRYISSYAIDTKDDGDPESTRRTQGSNHGSPDNSLGDPRVRPPGHNDSTKGFHRPSYLIATRNVSILGNYNNRGWGRGFNSHQHSSS